MTRARIRRWSRKIGGEEMIQERILVENGEIMNKIGIKARIIEIIRNRRDIRGNGTTSRARGRILTYG